MRLEERSQRCDRWLRQEDVGNRLEHAGGLIEEECRILDVMERVEKEDVGDCSGGKGKPGGAGEGIQPGRTDDIRRDSVRLLPMRSR